MMRTLSTFLILTLASFAAFAQTESKCFQNESLQGRSVVNFKTDGNHALSGTYSVEISGDGESAKTYEFGGVRKGNFLTVLFERDVLPDVAPSYIKSVVWALVKTGNKEVLEITFYGKNYETNKYADYTAEFESCEPSYQSLEKTAQAVQFAKGKSSASVPLSFKNTIERKVFSINMRRGQTLTIDAAGSKISVYLPSEKLYEYVEWENENGTKKTFASSTIDRMIIKPIPQTGSYLLVLRKMAEEARPDSVTFKITN
ncbi:MAG: hypothetical protein LH472_06455 [Pyrinomonadaceae bacterium]|nr:hypothetical protein [Pyrinomonadaceae bacterium]